MSTEKPSGGYAVMAQKHDRKDFLEYFPTPPWATRALCEWLTCHSLNKIQDCSVWEPACAEGHMARPLAEYFRTVHASDVMDYGAGYVVDDFLFTPKDPRADWIITNPPFGLGKQFAQQGIKLATRGVALLVRTAFLESAERYEGLYKETPPSDVLQFVERVPMFKGRLDRAGSTATAYCWLIWIKDYKDTRFHWIPPCRKRLERDIDYPANIKIDHPTT